MAERNGGAFVGGVLIGGAVGAIAGLLFAPRSGKDTRKILKKSLEALPELAEDLSDSLQLHADQLSETARRNWEDTLQRLQEAIAAGIEASQTEAQRLDAEEEELLPVQEIDPSKIKPFHLQCKIPFFGYSCLFCLLPSALPLSSRCFPGLFGTGTGGP